MTERVEPTNRLRWREPTSDEVTGFSSVWGRMPKVLQQLWLGAAADSAGVVGIIEEWRDVPTEEG